MALQPLPPSTIGACVEGTAGSGTATTAVLLPAGKQICVTNLGSVAMYFKDGTETGPDASSTTVGGGRAAFPAGCVQVFTKRPGSTHGFLYAASDCAYSIVGFDGQ